ncbi:MAG: sugar ABC transporter permease [Elusimicrobiota bacterium]
MLNSKTRETVVSYLFLAPFLAIFSVFLLYPVFYSLYLSFRSITPTTDLFNAFADMKFVGLKNYITLVNDFEFWWSLVTTGYYAVLYIPLSIGVSLVLAIILNNQLKGHSIFRSAYFLPNVLDMFVVGIIWLFIYAPHYGILDRVLTLFNITYFAEKGVLANEKTAMLGVVVALVLKNAGFGMILFLAAIQNISQSVFEAADIDGANEWQKFKHITLPLVRPIILFLVITGTIVALNAFAEIYAMTSGGPEMVVAGKTVGATKVSGYYLYRQFERMNYGDAAAISYFLLALTLVISYINAKVLHKKY